MDIDNMQMGFDPQSKTGLDLNGKWAPTVEVPLSIDPKLEKEIKENAEKRVQEINLKLENVKFHNSINDKYKAKIDELVKKFKNNELTVNGVLTEIGLMNKMGSEVFSLYCIKYFLEHISDTLDNIQKLSYQMLTQTHDDLLNNKTSKEEPKVEIPKEEPKKLGLNSTYPEGIIEYPNKVSGVKNLKITDPKPEYPFEDFELSVVRIYDDGRQEESQTMVLGWRGSIKGYVKVFKDDSLTELLYGFKQVIKNNKGRKPVINLGVKYHNKLGGFITPTFGVNGDEKINDIDVNFRIV